MIELASRREIEALKARWTALERTASDANVARDAGGKFATGVAPPKWKGFEKVDAEYRASEEKRKAMRPPRKSAKESDEHWKRTWKKFEDKSYYAR